MRTLTTIFFSLSLSLLLVSCGGNNSSGRNSNSNPAAQGIFAGYTGQHNIDQILTQITAENPCVNNVGRTTLQFQDAQRGIEGVNQGSVYIGVTTAGDIAIVTGNGQVNNVQLHICQHVPVTGQAQLSRRSVVTNSVSCPVGEVSVLGVAIGSTSGEIYEYIFSPYHVPQLGRVSSLCQGF